MKRAKTAYMDKPDAARVLDWIGGIDTENLQSLLYDLIENTGVLSGLQLQATTPATMNITVTRGRAAERIGNTSQARVLELFNDQDLDLTPYRVVGQNKTKFICVAYKVSTTDAPIVAVVNAPNTHPDYDPAFVGSNINAWERDALDVIVVDTPTSSHVVLGTVVIASTAVNIQPSDINTGRRQLAVSRAALSVLADRIAGLENDNATSKRQIAENATLNIAERLDALENVNTNQANKIAELEKIVGYKIGDMRVTAGPYGNPDDNWKIADGSELSKADYTALFALLGTRFGNGNGTTTFNLPDIREKFILGAQAASGATVKPGDTGGTKTVTLGVSEIPTHTHTATSNNFTPQNVTAETNLSGKHRHKLRGDDQEAGAFTGSSGVYGPLIRQFGNPPADIWAGNSFSVSSLGSPPPATATEDMIWESGEHNHNVTITIPEHNHSVTVENAGGNGAHNNMPPYVALTVLIRVK